MTTSRGIVAAVDASGIRRRERIALDLLRHDDAVAAPLDLPARDRFDSAGARSASPVRRLKHAWCHGQRTVSPTIAPSASGPP